MKVEIMKKNVEDLIPGDKYVTCIQDTVLTVEILGEKEPSPNQFGLNWFRYWATSENREGYVIFGPGATVTLA